ncbi:MAG TPA: immunoglobulin domain-containing protein, partial [Candidatus Sulfotelmatobacter sp.]|nr:immunoglobulin domain-containing protein [Candidatus Sulfotelmatobacter sp.]
MTNVIAIAARLYHNLALCGDGRVVAWGSITDGSKLVPATVPAGLSNLVAVSAGNYHALGLRQDGTVAAWGYDSSLGATNIPVGLSNVVAIAAGAYHSLALVSTNVLSLPNRLPDLAIHAGGTLQLQVAPVVSGIPSFQWRLNGTNLPGATNAFLRVPNMQPALAGEYSVIISNSAGATLSDEAQISVIPLWLVEHPRSQIQYVGGTARFSVQALGEGLSFQWRCNGHEIAGATQSALTLTDLQAAQSGWYSAVISNRLGSATSAEARLEVVQVAAWGDNSYGQTDLHPSLTNVAALKAGGYHNLALRQDGTVFAWGQDDGGSTNVPPGLSNIVAIAAGGFHNLALRADGTVAAWGYNLFGGTSVPASLTNGVAIAAGGYSSLVLRADGTVVGWGGIWGPPQPPAGLSNVVDIACSWNHALALRADGTVVGWGDNSFGQTSVPAWLIDAVAIAAGSEFSLALRADGTVVGWGRHFEGQTNVPVTLAQVQGIAAGGTHSLARRADGTLVSWGTTNYPHVPPVDLPPILATACGGSHSLALIGSGPPRLLSGLPQRTVRIHSTAYFRMEATGEWPLQYQWRCNGTNLPGATNAWLALRDVGLPQAGLYSIVVSNALGAVTSPEARLNVAPFFITTDLTNQVRSAGSTVSLSVGVEGSGPIYYQWRFNGADIAGATGATLVLENAQPEQAGSYSVLVSNAFGTLTSRSMQLDLPWVATWGRYSEGSYALPSGLTNLVAIAEGASHTLALRPDGTVLAWGYYNFGQTNIPAGLAGVAAISAGTYFSVALRSNGTVAAWGRSDLGSLNVPPGLNDLIAIAAGGQHTLALRSNGTVAAWGYNHNGQTIVPAGLTNVVAVDAGSDHSLALRADGTVVGWGSYGTGGAAVPAGLTNVAAIAGGAYFSLALRADGTVAAWG